MVFKEFINFIREQGVIGLAIGFILGDAIKDVVNALVEDIVNPVVGLMLGRAQTLRQAALTIGPVQIKWGDFVSVLIDFLILAAIIFLFIRFLKVSNLDKKKE